MGKGQLAGIPNWLKKRIKGIEGHLTDIAIPLLLSDWAENEDGTFTQTVTVDGLGADSVPVIALSSVEPIASEDELYSYACISDVETQENKMIFTASELPSISFTVVAKGAVLSETSTVSDVTSLVGKINELERNVLLYDCKNLLKNDAVSQTIDGITFTVNADGTITLNGTSTANTAIAVQSNVENLQKNKEYILSGTPDGGGMGTCFMDLTQYKADGGLISDIFDIGEGVKFVLADNCARVSVVIWVGEGQTFNNVVFKPIIRKADIEDDTYIPYTPDVNTRLAELEEEVAGFEITLGNECTLLFSGDSTGEVTLSEACENFKTLFVVGYQYEVSYGYSSAIADPLLKEFCVNGVGFVNGGVLLQMFCNKYSMNGVTITKGSGGLWNSGGGTTAASATNNYHIVRVYGVR